MMSPSILFTKDLKQSVPLEGDTLVNISSKSVEESVEADSRAILISSK